ncbi:MAG TPA: multidrug transporter subunit MdtN [Acetobacteraceae bacterium]|nr:multidrug transporter subunit MdtN [Acetobacteraceae bacterium]
MRLPPIRKGVGVLVSLLAFAAVIAAIVLTASRLGLRPRTDDAYLQADVVHMAPDVSGRIVELDVRDNQAVRRGQVLFRIDPVPYRLRVEQAQATVRSLEAKLSVTADQVAAQTSSADTANRGIATAEAQLMLASATLARMEPLLPRGYVTAEQVDQARTARRTAEIGVQQARLQAQSARQAISSTKPVAEELEAARATLAMAERDLRLTEAVSPCDGRITALDIADGEFAITGKPLFTIIDTEHWYAVGNFRETDLSGIKPGQRALVYVMQAPGVPVKGAVDSIGGGVAPDEGATFLGLPHVPRSLNWVRIAQRFPVRILLDNPPQDLMRIGATAAIVIER